MRPIDKAVWLLGLRPMDYPEDEAALSQSGAMRAKKKLSDSAKFKVETIRWCGNAFLTRVRDGDTVIQVMQAATSHYVEELARLIGICRTKSRRGTAAAYLYLECRNHPKRIPWAEFKRGCSKYGLRVTPNIGARQITSPAQAAKMLALVTGKQ